MARETSVVNPDRFKLGFNYPDYIGQIKVNKNRFNEFYNGFELKPEDAELFRELVNRRNGPAKMLVLGEDWCGDVVRGLPILARIAGGGWHGDEHISQGLEPRHHERVPKRRPVDVHTVCGVLHQRSPVHMPLD